MGVWTADGVICGSTSILRGGPDMLLSFWLVQVLKVLELYLLSIQVFSFSTFSSVGGYGSSVGFCGGFSRFGQLHFFPSDVDWSHWLLRISPVLEDLTGGQSPTRGNSLDMSPRLSHKPMLRYIYYHRLGCSKVHM